MPIKIKLIPNGPIALDAEGEDFPVLKAEGQDIPLSKKAFLCRCGVSQNKPYCDGGHAKGSRRCMSFGAGGIDQRRQSAGIAERQVDDLYRRSVRGWATQVRIPLRETA